MNGRPVGFIMILPVALLASAGWDWGGRHLAEVSEFAPLTRVAAENVRLSADMMYHNREDYREAWDRGDYWTCLLTFLDTDRKIWAAVEATGGPPQGAAPIDFRHSHPGITWESWYDYAVLGKARADGVIEITDDAVARIVDSMERELKSLLGPVRP